MTGEQAKGLLSKLWRVGLALILLVAVHSLSTPGYYWGLPDNTHYFSYHPDEVFLLLPSFRFAVGLWNPGFFNYGTLYIYLVGLPAVALGLVPDPASFPAGLRPLYEQGRMTTAVLGTLTVLLLYLALRRESRRVAAVAAALLAVCPLHVMHRSYATVDVPATFFITAAFLLALRGAARPHPVMGGLTGLAVGLAAATKYNAALFIREPQHCCLELPGCGHHPHRAVSSHLEWPQAGLAFVSLARFLLEDIDKQAQRD